MNDLSDYRIKNAKSRLDASKMLLEEGFYKDSINRSYYAIFDSMRTVLAEEGSSPTTACSMLAFMPQEVGDWENGT